MTIHSTSLHHLRPHHAAAHGVADLHEKHAREFEEHGHKVVAAITHPLGLSSILHILHNPEIATDHPEHSVTALHEKHRKDFEAHGHHVEHHHHHGHGRHHHGHPLA